MRAPRVRVLVLCWFFISLNRCKLRATIWQAGETGSVSQAILEYILVPNANPCTFEMGGPAALHRYHCKEKTWIHSQNMNLWRLPHRPAPLPPLSACSPPCSHSCTSIVRGGRDVVIQVSPGIKLGKNWKEKEEKKNRGSLKIQETEQHIFHLERELSGWNRKVMGKNLLQSPHTEYASLSGAGKSYWMSYWPKSNNYCQKKKCA